MIDFSILKGLTITSIEDLEEDSELVVFKTSEGRRFEMYHSQDCCESVSIEDVCGDVNDLLNSPILLAEEEASDEDPIEVDKEYHDDLYCWTFYKLSTFKGDVTIRWYGESNGYYSVDVNFCEIT